MAEFEQYTCVECGDEFRAHQRANVADGELCSPACESERL
jgi:DNA-directed RNA polymerase subunit RPC12/RpoP